MRHLSLLTLTALSLGFVNSPALADNAGAELNAFNEFPLKLADGSGQLKVKLRRNQGFIVYRLSYSDMDSPVLQAHIHLGNRWENGGIVAFLCANGDVPAPIPPTDDDVPPCPLFEGTVEGIIDPDDVIGPIVGDFDTLLDAIDAGATYVNVHTEANLPGQIRGQLTH